MTEVKIVQLNIKNLSQTDLAQLVRRFLTQIDEQALTLGDDATISTLMTLIRKELTAFEQSLNQVKGSSETATLAALDRSRDQAYQILVDALGLHRYETDAEKASAYQSVKRLLSSYKEIKEADYEAETNLINRLLEQLNKVDYKEAVSLLGLTSFISKLSDAQSAFEASFSKRAKEGQKRSISQSKLLKEPLMLHYNRLGQYVLIQADTVDDQVAKDLLETYNAGRKYMADKLARQAGKKKSKPTEETSEDKDE